jgi:hypothetical protein
MSVHVLRAHGMIYSELTRRFGANPARFHEILCGTLHPGSWEAAAERLAKGEPWHTEIAGLVADSGKDHILAELNAANPAKRRFQRQLKRLLKSAPPTASGNIRRTFQR